MSSSTSRTRPSRWTLSDRRRLLEPRTMEKGFGLILKGIGFDMGSSDRKRIPRRAAEAWRKEFLDGYVKDPASILSRTERETGGGLVMVKGISFTSMCPHHLLPYNGTAHVAYIPGGRIVGLNRLVMLVDCFAHRLELQERVTEQIAGALMAHLGAQGAACLMESEHACMTQRGVKREGARVVTTSLLGRFETDPRLAGALLSPIKRT